MGAREGGAGTLEGSVHRCGAVGDMEEAGCEQGLWEEEEL